MKESDIEKYLHKEIEKIGGTTRKWVSPGRVGVPDRICFYKGSVFFIEVKTFAGKLTKRQQREVETLLSHGANVYICVGFRDVDILVKRMKENERQC